MRRLFILSALVVASVASSTPGECDSSSRLVPKGDPYAMLGVPRTAEKDAIVKAYRLLARQWHPDKHRGECEANAEAMFKHIADAYEVLMDPTKRDVFDRLGEEGLVRLRDGDPTVHKDYLSDDEILRRSHKDVDESWQQWLVTAPFAYLSSCSTAAKTHLRWLPLLLGLVTDQPRVTITASSDATKQDLVSGGTSSGAVTFKLRLSGKSTDFTKNDVVHTCGTGAKFLGMKDTYYLQCPSPAPGLLSVHVPAGAFKALSGDEYNAASETFALIVR